MAAEVKTDVAANVPKAQEILASLAACFDDAGKSLPSAEASTEENNKKPSIIAPPNGISLLDTKTELLLSYIQNLSFLMVLQLRELQAKKNGTTSVLEGDDLVNKTHAKLKELKVYLERGVKPLEGRLKYQVDKVLKAADTEDQNAAIRAREKLAKQTDASDESSSENDESDDEEEEQDEAAAGIDDAAYRPNLSAFAKNLPQQTPDDKKSKTQEAAPSDGIYRPPRIKPTALPEHPDARNSKRADREAARAARSSVIDEYVNSEMSSAPQAQPSIGTTIRQGGRSVRSEAEHRREQERREYEEMNLVRLPGESKKDRAKRGGGASQRAGGYGGEDFRNLGVSADRIANLTKRSRGSGGVLDRSRKRRPTEDGPRGDGRGVGEGFEKRRKKVASWKK